MHTKARLIVGVLLVCTVLLPAIPAGAQGYTISGVAFGDGDGDGVRDLGEPGIAGATVQLTGSSSGLLFTGQDGGYSFSGLGAGTYTVYVFQSLPGYTFTVIMRTVTLPPDATTVDFPATPPTVSANPDQYRTDANVALAVPAMQGVIRNDFPVVPGTYTAEVAAPPTHAAAFALGDDGSFAYTPALNFGGTDGFTYRLRASWGGVSGPVAVRLDVIPTIASVAPDTGPIAGGTRVTARGAGFAAGATVSLNGTPATVEAVTETTVTFIAPPHAAGQVNVDVTTGGFVASKYGGYGYVGNAPPPRSAANAMPAPSPAPPARPGTPEGVPNAAPVRR